MGEDQLVGIASVRFPVLVYLRDRKTGRTGEYAYSLSWNAHDPDDDPMFPWEDGNFLCDCSRAELLYGDEKELPCGISRIIVDMIVRTDMGVRIYREWYSEEDARFLWCRYHPA